MGQNWLWNRLCLRLCVCLTVHTRTVVTVFDRFHETWRGGKNPKSDNEFIEVKIGPPIPYYAPKTAKAQKGARLSTFQPNHQRRKIAMSRSHHTGSLRHWHGRYSLQGDFMSGLTLENNKSKMEDGHHVGNTQAGVSWPLIGWCAPNLACSFMLAILETQKGQISFVFTRTWLRYVRVFAIAIPSVVCRLSVCRLSSVTLVHPTQGVEPFGKISSPLCTLAILWPPCKILRRLSQRNPSVGSVKRKSVSK